jgi:hypothetical protein
MRWSAALGEREDRLQLGLRAALEPDPVRPPVLDDLLDDVALLVDLDGVDGGVPARVVELLGRRPEPLGELLDARPEDVAEAEEHGERDALLLEVAGELEQRELPVGVAAVGAHDHVAARVDVEVAGAPALDVVERPGVVDAPRRLAGRLGRGLGVAGGPVLGLGRGGVDVSRHGRQT